MKDFIQIENNGYAVKISLENILYSDIEELLKEITEKTNWHWNSFYTNDKIWYCDGNRFLNCEAVNHASKVIIFE